MNKKNFDLLLESMREEGESLGESASLLAVLR